VETREAVDSPLAIGLEDRLGVGCPLPPIRWRQPPAKLAMIENFTVEHDHITAICREHRLISRRRQVDDRQAAMSELHVRAGPGVTCVGSSQLQPGHAPGKYLRRRQPAVVINGADDSAHLLFSCYQMIVEADGELCDKFNKCKESSGNVTRPYDTYVT